MKKETTRTNRVSAINFDLTKETNSQLNDDLKTIISMEKQIKKRQELLKQAKQHALSLMLMHGMKEFNNDRGKLTLVEATLRNSLDTRALKLAYPELVDKFTVEKQTKPYIKAKY